MRRMHTLSQDIDTALIWCYIAQFSHPDASEIVLLVGVAVALFFALLEDG